MALDFAIKTLPFYLSNAAYTPELAMHVLSIHNSEVIAGKDELRMEFKLLKEAIELYLAVRVYDYSVLL